MKDITPIACAMAKPGTKQYKSGQCTFAAMKKQDDHAVAIEPEEEPVPVPVPAVPHRLTAKNNEEEIIQWITLTGPIRSQAGSSADSAACGPSPKRPRYNEEGHLLKLR
jgi:hypothetical protein